MFCIGRDDSRVTLFTSTNLSKSPFSATISISPHFRRQLRSSTRNPFDSRYKTVTSSPVSPILRLGLGMVHVERYIRNILGAFRAFLPELDMKDRVLVSFSAHIPTVIHRNPDFPLLLGLWVIPRLDVFNRPLSCVCIVPNSHLFPKQSKVMTSQAPRAW